VSAKSAKGYAGERPIQLYLQGLGRQAGRPRAGAVHDIGDVDGQPFVISAKNHKTMTLSSWVDDLDSMVLNANVASGVVWHKRRGKSNPLDWYVTTSGRLFVPFMELAFTHWKDVV